MLYGMGKRKNDITIAPSEVDDLARNIEARFRQEIETLEEFTATRGLRIYTQLQEHIKKTTGVSISVSSLTNIMMGKHNGKFRAFTLDTLRKYVSAFRLALNMPETIGSQKLFWGPNQGLEPGAFVERIDGEFVEWNELKRELESRAIIQCPRIIPVGSKVRLSSFYEKKNWTVEIENKFGEIIGSVWVGGNPLDNWSQDGFIRVGKTLSDQDWIVYQVLARFPDKSYRLIKSFV